MKSATSHHFSIKIIQQEILQNIYEEKNNKEKKKKRKGEQSKH